MSKYNAKKCHYDGITFDSGREMKRYVQLKLMERAGEISDLKLQVKYELIPVQREPDIIGERGGVKKGKIIEYPCHYIADFVYKDKEGNQVVEDSKGFKTPEYKIKKKLALYMLGIRIQEV